MISKAKENINNNLMFLVNKQPKWNKSLFIKYIIEMNAYVLDYGSGGVIPSEKNFQVIFPEDCIIVIENSEQNHSPIY